MVFNFQSFGGMEQGHRCELIFNIDNVVDVDGDVVGDIGGDVDQLIHCNKPCPLQLMSSTGCCHPVAEY